MTVTRIPEKRVVGKPLGRNIRHDPRSLRYLQPRTTERKSMSWPRSVPAFDQGNVGSCTGNALVGVLATAPFANTIPELITDEALAVKVYSEATKLDPFEGSYLPTDTGSDGLSVAKYAKAQGWISGYRHITHIAAAHSAIQEGPFLVGTYWYESMYETDKLGLVQIDGQMVGGHEYECFAYDHSTWRWGFWNSWGPDWGRNGQFWMSDQNFVRLLSNFGDATVLVPRNEPAPEPAPVEPVARVMRTFTPEDIALMDSWAAARHVRSNLTAAETWKRGQA